MTYYEMHEPQTVDLMAGYATWLARQSLGNVAPCPSVQLEYIGQFRRFRTGSNSSKFVYVVDYEDITNLQ